MSESSDEHGVLRNLREAGVLDITTERTTFSFKNGARELQRAKWEFESTTDLRRFLSRMGEEATTDGGVRGTVHRRGKYVRPNEQGQLSETIGDPILDLITDQHGDVVIGGQRLAISRAELQEPHHRIGGIVTLDHQQYVNDIAGHQLLHAVMGEGRFVVTELRDGLIALASTNPSQRDYFLNGAHMRFKAWRKSNWFYWSMGAEIETWGHDFARARIQSRYLGEAYRQTCTVWTEDSDEDTDDDYVDEYEWGANAPQPIRVESWCTATWQGRNFSALVSAGADCYEV